MTVDIIRERLARENALSAVQENHVLREILQELALSGLARAGLFKVAAFHGGSSLRILHGLRRFSEDLDFMLRREDPRFTWGRFGTTLRDEFSLYGIDLEIVDRSDTATVKTMFLKDQSIGELLKLRNPVRKGQKLTIKLEVDTNPPQGATFETGYVDFPVSFSVLTHDLGSGLATKIHALLCRPYVKGRDWFDFVWYVGRKVTPAWTLLASALAQQGPFVGEKNAVDSRWLEHELTRKVQSIDWKAARRDVERFLDEPERRGLSVWGRDYFIAQIGRLSDYLRSSAHSG